MHFWPNAWRLSESGDGRTDSSVSYRTFAQIYFVCWLDLDKEAFSWSLTPWLFHGWTTTMYSIWGCLEYNLKVATAPGYGALCSIWCPLPYFFKYASFDYCGCDCRLDLFLTLLSWMHINVSWNNWHYLYHHNYHHRHQIYVSLFDRLVIKLWTPKASGSFSTLLMARNFSKKN